MLISIIERTPGTPRSGNKPLVLVHTIFAHLYPPIDQGAFVKDL